MIYEDLVTLGSTTAREGFQNERDIAEKFNNWGTDNEAKTWLRVMGYDLKKIENVIAVVLHGHKTDVQVQITIYMKNAIARENLSIKLVSNPKGFNQIDKRWVSKYVELWNIPDEVERLLKMFTGEISPRTRETRDERRIFLDEMLNVDRESILNFFRENKTLVVSDIIKGRGPFAAEWMLVALRSTTDVRWVLKSINEAMNVFSRGDIRLSPHGSLLIGSITMQRKGGDGGRHTANMLQFKINPVMLFDS